MFRFTIRDAILFTLFVATAVAWYCDHCRLARRNVQLQQRLDWQPVLAVPYFANPTYVPRAEAKEMRKALDELKKSKLDDTKVLEEPIVGSPPDWDALRKARSK